MWYIIPSIILVLSLPFYFLGRRYSENWFLGAIVSGTLCVFAFFFCPVLYYSTLTTTLQQEQYYQCLILPNKIQEDEKTITVSGLVPGVWQASTVVGFNSYLVSNRFWSPIPLIGTCIYPAPSYLKLVIVK